MTNQPTNKLQQIAAGTTPVTQSTTAPKAVVAPTPKAAGSNEAASVKGLILSVVQSLELIQEERDAQKEILAKLEADHGVSPKIARKVAKIIHKKNKAEYEAEQADVSRLYDRIS